MEFSFRPSKGAVASTLAVSAWFFIGGANANERQNEGESFPVAFFYGLTIDNINDVLDGAENIIDWGQELVSGSGDESQGISARQRLIAGSVIRFSGES